MLRYLRSCSMAEWEVWDRPTRFFHWATTALLAATLLTGWFDPAWQLDRHLLFGGTVGGLLLFRFIWGLVGPEYSRFTHYFYSLVGRRGKRGLAKFMVGDATAKVLDKAGCSVLVVPRLFSFWNSGVLLVVEPTTAEGDVAASAAFNVAKIAQLPLTILAVSEDDEEECRESNQVVNRLVAMAKLQKISAEGLVQPGDKVDVILEVARQRSTDIIVSEPYDRSVIDRLFNVNKLVRAIGKAHCPVLVARPSPAVAS
ncbi:MAG: universal stress protein [Magnetococcus sp. XQGC-1]